MRLYASLSGAITQLGERDTGSVEVGGSIPPSSTTSTCITQLDFSNFPPDSVPLALKAKAPPLRQIYLS